TTEKSPFWLDVTARGTSGHGSRPTPDNPVHRLTRALYRIANWQTPLAVTPTVERYFRDLSTIESDATRRAWLADVRAALRDPGELVTTRPLTGFTDSHYFRRLGIVSYGLSPFPLNQAESRGVHGNDERVSLDDLTFGVHFMYDAVSHVVAR